MGIESACIHRARQVGTVRGSTRSAQGEYERVPFTGPWVPARVMLRGAVSPKSRGANVSTEARTVRGYELLLEAEDETGAPIDAPTANSVFETDCPVLGNPTITLNGEPEWLNNGDELFGYMAYGDVPLERA